MWAGNGACLAAFNRFVKIASGDACDSCLDSAFNGAWFIPRFLRYHFGQGLYVHACLVENTTNIVGRKSFIPDNVLDRLAYLLKIILV